MFLFCRIIDRLELASSFVQVIQNQLTCRFTAIDTKTLHNPFFAHSTTTVTYFNCLKQFSGIYTELESFKKCVNILISKCAGSRLKIATSENFALNLVHPIRELMPSLKIIYLYPDEFIVNFKQEGILFFKYFSSETLIINCKKQNQLPVS